jgi:hypothetical protein
MPRIKKKKDEVVIEEVVVAELEVKSSDGMEERENLWKKLSRGCVVLALVLLPLLFIPGAAAITFVIQETVVGVLILASLFFLLIDFLKERRLLFAEVPLVVFYLFGIFVLGTLLSLYRSDSFNLSFWGSGNPEDLTVFVLLISLIGFFLGSVLFHTRRNLTFLTKSLTVSFLLSILLTIISNIFVLVLKQPFFGIAYSGFNMMGTLSSFSVFLGVVFFFSFITLMYIKTRLLSKVVLGSLGALSFIYLLLIGNGVIFVSSVVTLLVILGLWAVSVRGESGGQLRELNAIIFFVLVFCLIAISGYRPGSFLNLPLEAVPSFYSSISITTETLRQGTWSLLLGSGPNTYFANYVRFKPLSTNLSYFWDTDFQTGYSWWLTLVPTLGIIVSISLAASFVFLIVGGLRRILVGVEDDDRKRIKKLVLILAFFLLLNSFFSGFTVALMVYLFFCFGLLAGLGRLDEEEECSFHFRTARRAFISSLGTTSLIILILIIGFVASQRLVAFAKANRAVALFNEKGDTTVAIREIGEAYQIFPQENTARVMSSLWLTSLMKTMRSEQSSSSNSAQRELDNSLAYASESIRLDSVNHQNWAFLGNIYKNVLSAEGAAVQALGAYEEARKLNPTSPAYPLFIGQLRLVQAQVASGTDRVAFINQAEADIKESIRLKSDLSEAHYILEQLYESQGRIEEARAQLQELLKLNPGDQSIIERLKTLVPKK